MTITAILGLETCQIDVYNAYLEGGLEEKIYMKIFKRMNIPDQVNMVLLLLKHLYGLKEWGQIWHRKFRKFLILNKFTLTLSNNYVFINYKTGVIILVYVDNFIIFFFKKFFIKM